MVLRGPAFLFDFLLKYFYEHSEMLVIISIELFRTNNIFDREEMDFRQILQKQK